MKILILGAGQAGSTVTESLVSEANDITVVDTDAEKLRVLQDRFDLRTLGNASHPSALEQAASLYNTPTRIARHPRRRLPGTSRNFQPHKFLRGLLYLSRTDTHRRMGSNTIII